VRESACPVIVLLHAPDPDFVRDASRRGVFALISEMLRDQSRTVNRKLIDMATAIVDGHRLLSKHP
jgi:AmiR/NasT family two-component response regulator